MTEKCFSCTYALISKPASDCQNISHWSDFLDQKDDDRDKLDVAEWLSSYEKVKSYNCHGCNRHYEIPTHINHFTCICGHKCRLRYLGGTNSDQAVIDSAISYFGNERLAQLAWIAEIIGGEHCLNYTADEIRKMIRQEMDDWVSTKNGWERKK